jgi:hypothetical protein
MTTLATVEKIEEILPHGNADALEIARVLGWLVIVKKGEFKAGDQCVYVQVDSILPEKPEFEFLRDRKFRVVTIKLRGVYSQGICFPTSVLPAGAYAAGDDVTDIVGVTKYEKAAPVEQVAQVKKGFFAKWYSYLRWKALGLFGYFEPNGSFPTDIVSKTDEDRIQGCMARLHFFRGNGCYATIKHDGTSATFIRNGKKLRVCSRNQELAPDDGVYWEMAKKYNLAAIPAGYSVQAEIVGPKIQGNSETLKEPEIRVFNVYFNRKALSYSDMLLFCGQHNLPMADLYFHGVFEWETVEEIMAEVAKARYKNGTQAEGLVFRTCEPVNGKYMSFKAVSPEYCFKHGE